MSFNVSIDDDQKKRRQKGLMKMLIGFFGAFGMGIVTYYLHTTNWQLGPKGLIVFAIPGAYGLAGLVEFVTGKPLSEISRWWDGLKGWQRGVYGTSAFLVAFFLFIIITIIVLAMMGYT